MAWCFHGGLFSFTKIVIVSDSCEICPWFPILHFSSRLCRFGICFNCITFAQLSKVENSDVIYVLQSGEAINYQQQNWRVGKHMLCHFAVKQYIKLFEIFVTKSLDETFFFKSANFVQGHRARLTQGVDCQRGLLICKEIFPSTHLSRVTRAACQGGMYQALAAAQGAVMTRQVT